MNLDDVLADLDAAGLRVVSTVAALDDASLREPSLLPEWSRGHVVAHIARNADGIVNLMRWARTGEQCLMYPTRAVRAAEIEAGSTRPHDVVLADLEASIQRIMIDLRHMPPECWANEVALGPGPISEHNPRMTAGAMVGMRLFEVEVHHVDIDRGYGFAQTPVPLAARLLEITIGRVRVDGDGFTMTTPAGPLNVAGGGSVRVSASAADALAWLLGRSPGTGCITADGAPLPVIKPL